MSIIRRIIIPPEVTAEHRRVVRCYVESILNLKELTMSLVSVPAIYDGKQIRLLQLAPVREPYRVLVTFIAPTHEVTPPPDLARFWASFGAWQDERSVEDTLRDIHEARRSRMEPPAL